jgi:hypothetical protein
MSKKIKLKDLLEENFSIAGGVVSQNAFNDNMSLSRIVKEKYGDIGEDKIDVKGLTTELSQYNDIGEAIFGKSNISKISEKLSWIAGQAKSHTLSETEDWFDKITVNRNMKELTGLSNEIGEKHIPGHDSDDIETADIEENAYEKFFQGAMKKFGISSPDELDDDKKKEFFNYVDKNYKAKKETD